MTKKNKDFVKELQEKVKAGVKPSQIKKSKSLESLSTKSPENPETTKIKELKAQITALLEQISRIKQEANQQIQFESQKAQNYLEQITKLTAEIDSKEQVIKELTTEKNKLADQNSELRINNLKQDNYFTKYQSESKLTQQLKLQLAKCQKDLTISQQDLKKSQRIIELRTIKPDDHEEKTFFNHWTWIRFGLLTLLTYLLLNNLQKQENYHGKLRN